MSRRSIVFLAVAATTAACSLAAVSSGFASGPGPRITVRIEGAKRTLLPATSIQVPAAGSITQGGAPAGKCPAESAAGALNVATKGSWTGSWSNKYSDYLITTILKDTESGSKSYWEILVNDVPASTGACEVKLEAGQQLLFAAVPATGKGYPLVLKAPAAGTVGASLKVTVAAINGKGSAVPLAGATVSGAGETATTNARGVATLPVKSAGTLVLGASEAGYVRAAAVTVHVAA
jgi:hypothetical protein